MKTLLITGVSRGIGHALAKALSEQGHYTVYGISRTHAPDLPLVHQISCDLSSPSNVSEVLSTLPPIDVLIQNAGVFLPDQEQWNSSQFQQLLATNLIGAIELIEYYLPTLVARQGQLINICSITVKEPKVDAIAYAISKNALYDYGKHLQKKYKHSLKVTQLLLGATNSSSWEGYPYPNRLIQQEELVKTIQFILNAGTSLVIEELVLNNYYEI